MWRRRQKAKQKPDLRLDCNKERKRERNWSLYLGVGLSFIGALALLGSMGYGWHACNERAKRYWQSRAPMCEGPKVYKVKEGESRKHIFHAKKKLRLKRGDSIDHKGKAYVVVGAASRDTNGTLIVREKDGENFALIHTGSSEFSRFSENFRFDGWSCEKPKTAKPE